MLKGALQIYKKYTIYIYIYIYMVKLEHAKIKENNGNNWRHLK